MNILSNEGSIKSDAIYKFLIVLYYLELFSDNAWLETLSYLSLGKLSKQANRKPRRKSFAYERLQARRAAARAK